MYCLSHLVTGVMKKKTVGFDLFPGVYVPALTNGFLYNLLFGDGLIFDTL